MTLTKTATVTTLEDGRQVLLSYGTPVAAFVPGRGYVQTDRKYSVTTSKHVKHLDRAPGHRAPARGVRGPRGPARDPLGGDDDRRPRLSGETGADGWHRAARTDGVLA